MTDWPLSTRLREFLEVQYDLRRVLGVGGMGAVLLANERALDRLVAIKVLHADRAGDAESRERFRREARSAAKLTHPNIVPLLTFGEVEGELYYVMGFVEGETLAARLERVRRLAPEEARARLAEIADALAYAHGAGIVHRDLKPENILLEAGTGRAVLTDFGIARDILRDPSLTSTGVIVGTPHYMSPEQASGERAIDGRSDIYSLGVIGYRMLSGSLPFNGTNAREVLVQHLTSVAAPLPPALEQSAPALAQTIRRAMAKAPEERWGNARELAVELQSGTGEEVLPEAIERFDGLYARIGLIGAAAGEGLLLARLAGISSGPWWQHLLASAVAVGGVGLIGLVAHLGERWRDRATAMRKLEVGLRPPRWWNVWWPKRFRRPGDVWARLGRELRLVRWVNAVSLMVLLPLQAAGFIWMLTGDHGERMALAIANHRQLANWAISGAVVIALGSVAAIALSMFRFRKRRGFAIKDVQSMQALANADSRWAQPRYARFLEDARPEPVSEASISDLIGALRRSGVALPDGLTTALDAVRDAESALDRELDGLREIASTDETVRLDKRLAALGNGDPQLRALLESQRALLARAESRIAELGGIRERLSVQQQVLRQQLLALRDLATTGEDLSEITGRIRAVNDDLRRLSRGVAEVSNG